MAVVICAGLITVDFVFEVAGFPVEGQKSRANHARMIAGGGALNAAAAVAALGGTAILAGAVGDDAMGTFLRAEMRRLSIRDDLVTTVENAPTARSVVLVSGAGERTIVNHRDERLFAQEPDMPVAPGFDAVLTDTRWIAGAGVLFEAARQTGRPRILDAEAPMAPAAGLLGQASHAVFSEQGLADLSDGAAEDVLRSVCGHNGLWAAVTRGAAPVLCHDGDASHEVPGFAVDPVDTLGAGDVWHGAFALGMAQGRTESDAALRANAAAALKVVQQGIDDLPGEARLEAFMAEQGRT